MAAADSDALLLRMNATGDGLRIEEDEESNRPPRVSEIRHADIITDRQSVEHPLSTVCREFSCFSEAHLKGRTVEGLKFHAASGYLDRHAGRTMDAAHRTGVVFVQSDTARI